jgi:hypothetical protein
MAYVTNYYAENTQTGQVVELGQWRADTGDQLWGNLAAELELEATQQELEQAGWQMQERDYQ